MDTIPNNSISLVVTSPPYPMIEMWDDIFSSQDCKIAECLKKNLGLEAFYSMHKILNNVWAECDRVLIDNGFICINIGDATRTINDEFQLYSNHTEIINWFLNHGYCVLPDIHWRKQSNSPNKFMGSGMYPAGAYVTYEHEYILIFRKGGKRVFTGEQKAQRQKSAFFWEERNVWFSDLWDIKGTSQKIETNTRNRNASFPFEIPYRLVNMYSVEGDTVLDPFCGCGTTNLACMASNRNSIGIDIDKEFAEIAISRMELAKNDLNSYILHRLSEHNEFINELSEEKRQKCYKNQNHSFLVKTKQETAAHILCLKNITRSNSLEISCSYA